MNENATTQSIIDELNNIPVYGQAKPVCPHPHPAQPLVMDNDTLRFQANAIVKYLMTISGTNLNVIGELGFPVEDEIQFAQLLGGSVKYFLELPYVTSAAIDRLIAQAQSQTDLLQESDGIPARCKACGTVVLKDLDAIKCNVCFDVLCDKCDLVTHENVCQGQPEPPMPEIPHIKVVRGPDQWLVTSQNGLPAKVECVHWDGSEALTETYTVGQTGLPSRPHFVTAHTLGYTWECPLCLCDNRRTEDGRIPAVVTCDSCGQEFNAESLD